MRKGSFFENVQSKILGEGEKAPKGWELAALLEGRYREIKRQDDQVGGNDAKEAFVVKFYIGYGLVTGHPAKQLSPDEVAAENEKEVNACPSEATYLVQVCWMTEDPVMINENKDNSQGAKVIQACQAAC